jgi:MarR family multiple gene transcriptional regulator MgrA
MELHLYKQAKNYMGAIEDLIKQTKFESEYHRSLISLIYLTNIVNADQQQFFKQFDITPQQYNVLRILRGQLPNPATVNLIRDRMLDKSSDVSRIVERLRKVGLIERGTCEKDRRAVDIVITKKGLNLLAEIDVERTQINSAFNALNEEEVKQFNGLIDKILQNFLSN